MSDLVTEHLPLTSEDVYGDCLSCMDKNDILKTFQSDFIRLLREKLPCQYKIGREMYYAYRGCLGVRIQETWKTDSMIINYIMRRLTSDLREPTEGAICDVYNVILTRLSEQVRQDGVLDDLQKARQSTVENSLILLDIQGSWNFANIENVQHCVPSNTSAPDDENCGLLQVKCRACTDEIGKYKEIEQEPFIEDRIKFSLRRVLSFMEDVAKVHIDVTTKIIAYFMLSDDIVSRVNIVSEQC